MGYSSIIPDDLKTNPIFLSLIIFIIILFAAEKAFSIFKGWGELKGNKRELDDLQIAKLRLEIETLSIGKDASDIYIPAPKIKLSAKSFDKSTSFASKFRYKTVSFLLLLLTIILFLGGIFSSFASIFFLVMAFTESSEVWFWVLLSVVLLAVGLLLFMLNGNVYKRWRSRAT